MSTNIHITATREVIVVKTGKRDYQTTYFEAWQTPTATTYAIMASPDRVQAYKDWALSMSEDREEDVYAEDDIFEEGEPVGKVVVNYGKDHIAGLDDWIKNVEEAGYTIEFEAW